MVKENNSENKPNKEKWYIKHPGLCNLAKAIVFVSIFIIVITELTYVMRTNGDVKDRFAGFYAEKEDSLDIILIGSSPTYSSVSTPMLYGEYGIKAYPLASNVQRPAAGLYLVKEAQKTQSPDLYIFEMRMYSSNEEGLTSHMAYTRGVTDNMKYSINRINAVNALVPDPTERYTYIFDIFKYHSNWKMLTMKDQWGFLTYTKRDPLKGTLVSDQVGPAQKPDFDVKHQDPSPLDPAQEEALDNLLAYLKDNNLNALFYVSPYDMEGEEANRFEYIKKKVKAEGYPFLNMNKHYDDIDIDFEKDFSDYGTHTNAVGEAKCTKYLADYLTENYDFTDHRENEDDNTWPQAYDLWTQVYSDAEAKIAERIENEDWIVLEEEE